MTVDSVVVSLILLEGQVDSASSGILSMLCPTADMLIQVCESDVANRCEAEGTIEHLQLSLK